MSKQAYFQFRTEGKWYEGHNFEDAHLVTEDNYNKDLSIENIVLLEPRSKKDDNVLALVNVIMDQINFEGTIFLNPKDNSLIFNVPQREWRDNDGKTQYTPYFNLSRAVSAQVLRHAESRRLAKPIDWAVADGTATTQQNDLASVLAGMTPEQQVAFAQAMASSQTNVQTQTQTTNTAGTTSDVKLPPGFETK